jgi:ribosomal-protein-alanine N-acetyltransferase
MPDKGFSFGPLQTARLTLRPLRQEDLDFVYRHFSNPEVNRYLYDKPPVASLVQAQEIIDSYDLGENSSANRWVLGRNSDGQPLGTCGYHQWNRLHRRAEIGYDLDPAAWKQGYMSEALTAALQFGFTAMALNRVAALVYPGNRSSVGLLKKLGFTMDGTLRGYYRNGGVVYDHWIYSLLKADWAGEKGS